MGVVSVVCVLGMSQVGVPVAKLKRKRSLTVALDDHVERFKALMHIYTEIDGTPAAMSDLTSTADVMCRHPLMSTCAPALHFIVIMGKVGPFKSAVGAGGPVSSKVMPRSRFAQHVGACRHCCQVCPCGLCSTLRQRT